MEGCESDHFVFVRPPDPALEAVTQGLARATSHRVLSPAPGSTPRYSIPFFQNIAQGIQIKDMILDCKCLCLCGCNFVADVGAVKPEILKLKQSRGQVGAVDCQCSIVVICIPGLIVCCIHSGKLFGV